MYIRKCVKALQPLFSTWTPVVSGACPPLAPEKKFLSLRIHPCCSHCTDTGESWRTLCFTAWNAIFSAIKTQPQSVSQTSTREGGLYLSWFCLPSTNRKINGLCSFIEEKKVLTSHLGGLMGFSGVQNHFSGEGGVPAWSLLMKVFSQMFMLPLGHKISGSGSPKTPLC